MSGGGPKYEADHLEGKPDPNEFVNAPRKERIEEVIANRTRNFVVVLDRLEDQFNMAAVLRTCESMGVQEIHIIKNKEHPWSPNSKVTQGCDKWLDIVEYVDFAECMKALKARGFTVLASAIRDGATSLYDIKFDQKIAIVFGNERYGVSEEVLTLSDGVFWIPMHGFTQSLNISAAASACVSRAISWRIEHLGKSGDLTEAEAADMRQRFLFLSVKQRGRLYGQKR